MNASLVRPVRRLLEALVAHDAPSQLASGFALGIVLGLVPKGNLIALSLLVLLFSLRVNKGMALAAALVCSWLGPALDPLADKLGSYVLSIGSLQATYASLFQLPLGPWLEFDNTVVIGSLLIGLYIVYPAYWICYVACCWLQSVPATATHRHTDESPFVADGPSRRRAA
jgi:uncharacterized protein (TIGR03546 family)